MSARSDGSNVIPTQEIAAKVLAEVERSRISVKSAVQKLAGGFDYKVRGSVHAYSVETLKRLNAIDYFLKSTLKKFDGLDPFTRNLLRIAVYEMKYKGVHPALATDSAVRIARERGKASLVNAVLRKVEKLDIQAEGRLKELSLTYFHPEWFVKYAIELLGEDGALKLMKANLRNPPTYVRVNELKGSVESVREYLASFWRRLFWMRFSALKVTKSIQPHLTGTRKESTLYRTWHRASFRMPSTHLRETWSSTLPPLQE